MHDGGEPRLVHRAHNGARAGSRRTEPTHGTCHRSGVGGARGASKTDCGGKGNGVQRDVIHKRHKECYCARVPTHTHPPVQAPVQSAVAWAMLAPKRPPGQKEQPPAPAKLYRPTAQGSDVGDVLCPGQEYPALQGPLHAAVPSPTNAPKRPAGQIEHMVDPARLNLLNTTPGKQREARHSEKVACHYSGCTHHPAGHTALQRAADSEPSPGATPMVPAGQGLHGALPRVPYRPRGHTEFSSLT